MDNIKFYIIVSLKFFKIFVDSKPLKIKEGLLSMLKKNKRGSIAIIQEFNNFKFLFEIVRSSE